MLPPANVGDAATTSPDRAATRRPLPRRLPASVVDRARRPPARPSRCCRRFDRARGGLRRSPSRRPSSAPAAVTTRRSTPRGGRKTGLQHWPVTLSHRPHAFRAVALDARSRRQLLRLRRVASARVQHEARVRARRCSLAAAVAGAGLPLAALAKGPESVAALAAQLSPAVVNIAHHQGASAAPASHFPRRPTARRSASSSTTSTPTRGRGPPPSRKRAASARASSSAPTAGSSPTTTSSTAPTTSSST